MEKKEDFIPWFIIPEQVYAHKDCQQFNPAEKKCLRRNVEVDTDAMACKYRDVNSNYMKFECKNCDVMNGLKIEKTRKFFNKGMNKLVVVAFFRCSNCGKVTALSQPGRQVVIPVNQSIESIDLAWVEENIFRKSL